MINVYLDDMRACPKGFYAAMTAEECLLYLENYDIHVLSLDYDLGWGQPNAMTVVEEMVRRGLYARTIYCHSSDMEARRRMAERLRACCPPEVQVVAQPMSVADIRAAVNAVDE